MRRRSSRTPSTSMISTGLRASRSTWAPSSESWPRSPTHTTVAALLPPANLRFHCFVKALRASQTWTNPCLVDWREKQQSMNCEKNDLVRCGQEVTTLPLTEATAQILKLLQGSSDHNHSAPCKKQLPPRFRQDRWLTIGANYWRDPNPNPDPHSFSLTS